MVRASLFGLILAAAAAGIGTAAQDEQPQERRDGGEHRPQQRMMGPGPSTMVVHKDHLYILSGPTLYKVDPTEMKVVAELQVIKPKGGEPRGEPSRDPNRDK